MTSDESPTPARKRASRAKKSPQVQEETQAAAAPEVLTPETAAEASAAPKAKPRARKAKAAPVAGSSEAPENEPAASDSVAAEAAQVEAAEMRISEAAAADETPAPKAVAKKARGKAASGAGSKAGKKAVAKKKPAAAEDVEAEVGDADEGGAEEGGAGEVGEGHAHRAERPEPKLERLQKILARAGISSRRRAEELILGGHVQVNGKVVTELGSKADAERDHVRVDGKLLQGAERVRYFVLNKPKGYVTTVSDPEGRPTVMQFFDREQERLYPVGRLDYLSEGLLLVTNDGELANKLTRASSGVEKTYLVKVAGQPTEDMLETLRQGVVIEKGRPGTGSGRVRTAPAQIRQVRQGDNPWYEVTVIEGRNRELRKMFEEIGHHVEKIRRIGYGPLILDLEPGKSRELDEEELRLLRLAADGKLKTRRRRGPAPAQLPREAGRAVRFKKADGKPGYEKPRFARPGMEAGSFERADSGKTGAPRQGSDRAGFQKAGFDRSSEGPRPAGKSFRDARPGAPAFKSQRPPEPPVTEYVLPPRKPRPELDEPEAPILKPAPRGGNPSATLSSRPGFAGGRPAKRFEPERGSSFDRGAKFERRPGPKRDFAGDAPSAGTGKPSRFQIEPVSGERTGGARGGFPDRGARQGSPDRAGRAKGSGSGPSRGFDRPGGGRAGRQGDRLGDRFVRGGQGSEGGTDRPFRPSGTSRASGSSRSSGPSRSAGPARPSGPSRPIKSSGSGPGSGSGASRGPGRATGARKPFGAKAEGGAPERRGPESSGFVRPRRPAGAEEARGPARRQGSEGSAGSRSSFRPADASRPSGSYRASGSTGPMGPARPGRPSRPSGSSGSVGRFEAPKPQPGGRNSKPSGRLGPDGLPRVKERHRNSFTGKNKGRPKPKGNKED
jgi:23S rRNA pseudouridine2605 synthase